MLFLFDNESFSFEALRAAGYATYAGAELGEVLVTCRAIPEGDEDAWSRQWARTAERVEEIGRTALGAGHRISAREALLRASNYYRTADFYRREDPSHDAESARLSTRSQQAFADAAGLLDHEARPVRIPYRDTSLPGYLYLAPEADGPRPLIIYHGGYDSTLEEDYLALAAGAVRRGYHVLTFDGPGQGSALRDQGLHFRPDWEAVVSPVVDFALTLPEADADRLVLIGTSLGGYLAARAAAFEPRLAACILHDGVYSLYEALEAMTSIPEAELMSHTATRWVIQNGLWTFGAKDLTAFGELGRAYTLAGVAGSISCATLVLDAENDQFFKGQAEQVFSELTCKKDLIQFKEADGGGEHCHEGALALWHQQAFDWLDQTLLSRV